MLKTNRLQHEKTQTAKGKAGLYLHLPFCHSKCTYCGFVTGSYQADLAGRYLAALETEIRHFPPRNVAVVEGRLQVDTVYFGGGTPSILEAAQISNLLKVCRECFSLTPDAEITIEVNPGDTAPERVAAWKAAGMNRASLGVQSFFDHHLQAAGRDHTAAQAREAFQALRQGGFENLSIDLIAGLPRQTLAEWESNLEQALGLEPEHVSLYLLEVKEGTKLAQMVATGRLPVPDEDLGAEMYEVMLNRLEQAGFDAYEISNFARHRALRARHNLKYWTETPFYGFGVGAHSYDGEERYWNTSLIHEYLEQIETTGQAIAERTARSAHEKFHEALMMGLRLRDGISLDSFHQRYGIDLRERYQSELERLAEAETIEIIDDTLCLTRKGVLLSNEVFLSFME
ncbi:MAG: radical SAM family heme chaperone HemW [Blastocatellia bacterium]|nr:radical SAM family heme chaperone HemW [Blastocatellia bacterium]